MNRRSAQQSLGIALVAGIAWITIPVFGQTSAKVGPDPNARAIQLNRGAGALWRTLRELHTRASLIMFTAHPDDEDGGVLTYESREVGADTNLFTLNRGEGGQNVMSSNFWDQLGIVRTEELLKADQYYGVHQYWSRAADFGFTKTKEEAMQKWGYDRVLYDSVRVVRMTRPLVVTSVFSGNVSDGHGQHQVAGQMAQEVYNAAADPKMFPDQIRAGLRPWAPLKMYVRTPFATISSQGVFDYATGHWAPARFHDYIDNTWIDGKPSPTLAIPVGLYGPSLGLSYLQIAREGWGQQKSQNGGYGIPAPGPDSSPYRLYASRVSTTPKEAGFFDGIDVSLAGIADYASADQAGWIRENLTSINALVEQAMQNYSIAAPEKIAPVLAHGLIETEWLIQQVQQKPLPEDARYNILHELSVKKVQFNTALTQALGLSIEAVVSNGAEEGRRGHGRGASNTFQSAIPGQTFQVRVHLADQGSDPVTVKDVHLVTTPDKDWKLAALGAVPTSLSADDAEDAAFSVTVPADATITKPYFTRPNLEQPYYDVSNPAYLNRSWMPYPLAARTTVTYRGAEIVLDQVVQTMHAVHGFGPVLEPLLVAPAISVWVSPKAGIVPLASKSFTIRTRIHSNVEGPATGSVSLKLPDGWRSNPTEAHFATQQDGGGQNIQFQIFPNKIELKSYRITATAIYQGQSYSSGSTAVGYTGLRSYPYYRDATYQTTGVDIHLPTGLTVGYVTGTGDSLAASLQDLGIQTTFLSAQDIATGSLDRFRAIVLGVRAYAVRPELKAFNARLLEYVKNGGTLIVQYNLTELGDTSGPYPFQLGGNPEKVIDENSQVSFLDPNYPALQWPNKVTARDFDGWVEERGHGFMRSWDSHYTAPTETHDPNQDPQKGGLLIAPYGKGFYVYDAYAFYRQLPEGVPGAYRIFANLLSLSSNPGMQKKLSAPAK
ncbi:MAG: PIG-L family deacetylase [Acidobacteriaceae bacterium]